MQHQFEATPRQLLGVQQFSQKYPAWTPAALRGLIYSAAERQNSRGQKIPSNGLSGAIVRVGRRVLIDESAFFEWIADQQRQRRA